MKNPKRIGASHFSDTWQDKDSKEMTRAFINHLYLNYYNRYKKDADYYERINNILFGLITTIGFITTITVGIQEVFKEQLAGTPNKLLTIATFILPSLSSMILMYMSQKGFKKKEEIREEARIESKFLLNEAKIRFAKHKDNCEEMEQLYHWLNERMKELQIKHSKTFFTVHNNRTAAVEK